MSKESKSVAPKPVTASILNFDGKKIGDFTIIGSRTSDLNLVQKIPLDEALKYGEEQVQLVEGGQYQYKIVEDKDFKTEEVAGLISPFLLETDGPEIGSITIRNRTGQLRIWIKKNGKRIGSVCLEVRSRKIEYREDYRVMLEDIAEASTDLLLSLRGTTETRLTIGDSADSSTLQQRFLILKGFLYSSEFREAVNRILSSPYTKLIRTSEEISINKSAKPSSSISRQIASRHPRSSISNSHPIYGLLGSTPSLPKTLVSETVNETIDNHENRFIKYTLSDFLNLTYDVEKKVLKERDNAGAVFVKREVEPIKVLLEDLLGSKFFSSVGQSQIIPISSPVLQRRAGYREMLQYWLRAQALAKLVWRGANDVFSGGQRDVATLYEYWVFFSLWRIADELAKKTGGLNLDDLFESTKDGLGFKLKTGEFFSTKGALIEHKGKRLRLQFSYNRTFPASSQVSKKARLKYSFNYPTAGAWTRNMRPDFTFSFWPDGLSIEGAESLELIVHVHFDAKYSVSHLAELFDDYDEDIGEQKKEVSRTFKRSDLIKMHAYRDAIRRTHGAYVIYPGEGEKSKESKGTGYKVWLEYHEILPGLGAFPLRPKKGESGKHKVIQEFIYDILDTLIDPKSKLRASQRSTRKLHTPV